MSSRRAFISSTLRNSLKVLALSSGLVPLLTQTARSELFGKIPEDMPKDRSIYRLTGDVFVDGTLATLDTFISANALIKTGSGAEVIFVVGDDAHILRENSEIQLSGQGIVETGLKVITGKILSVFGRRKSDESISLSTSTATIGIRGTGVYLESSDELSYVCTCYGIADIEATASGERETVKTQRHDDPRFVYKTNGSSLIQKAPLFNHTDEELALIEALVGRQPPFANFSDSYGGTRRDY